jgi:hypothetical protein
VSAEVQAVPEPETPVTTESRLRWLGRALEDNTGALKEMRDAELEAEEARDSARRGALLSSECPRTGTFGGLRITVAERDAWVEEHIKDEEHTYRIAAAATKAAEDQRRKLESQLRAAQSINSSVRESYRGTWGRS